jgi:hypothetical protein
MRIGNDSTGFTQLVTAIAELVPGRRVVASVEGSRSYGVEAGAGTDRGRLAGHRV